ncbi:hypothetical protein CW731_03360 [Polaribacter sp. ALD11]|uniref:DUF6508 domain-containing protein n=1 Tax=Polaribacter sp. ALD11 TaxID=2058137 RepID=UPI000C303B5B|nr:DUF6508 domain-containing protein [Polaribacter sp. ALD11]AUC84394.1 hypothetical protein CW731_03360 [Polaribacter sp. ALD11]
MKINLIEAIEKTKIENGVFPNLYRADDKIRNNFITLYRKHNWQIIFDWTIWDEGKIISRNKNFNYSTINFETKCKLLTAIVRNDRFYDGAIIEALNSGLILKILKTI